MHLKLAAIIAILFIAGCSSAPPQQNTDYLNHLGTIAIISLLGNEISLQHVGSSGNPRARSIVTTWSQDDYAVRAATNYLTNRGHKVAHLRYKTASLLKVYADSQLKTQPIIENIRAKLRNILDTYPANTFIIIYRNQTDDFIGDTGEVLFSQGLYNLRKTFGSDTTASYSSLRIDLIRTNDFSIPTSANVHAHTVLHNSFWHHDYERQSQRPVSLKSSGKKKIMSFIQRDLNNAIHTGLLQLGL